MFSRKTKSPAHQGSLKSFLGAEQGASMVEMAVSSTVLLGVMFAMLQICLAMYAYAITAMVARQTTRYAIVRGSSCSSFASACPATSAQIKSYAQGLQYPGVNASNFTVTPTWAAFPSGGSCTPSASCNNPGNLVKVTVQYSFAVNLPFLKSFTMPLQSTSEMIISQ